MTIIWITVFVSMLVLLLIIANFSAFCDVFAKLWVLYDTHEEVSAAQEALHHAAQQAVGDDKSEKSDHNHSDDDDDPTADKSA